MMAQSELKIQASIPTHKPFPLPLAELPLTEHSAMLPLEIVQDLEIIKLWPQIIKNTQ